MEGDDSQQGEQVTAALQQVLKVALVSDGVARGLNECVKRLDSGRAQLCILASNCDEPGYVKLVEALCAARDIPLIKIGEKQQLGQMAGLCKIDKDGNSKKVVSCSCVVITDYGHESSELDLLNAHIKKLKSK